MAGAYWVFIFIWRMCFNDLGENKTNFMSTEVQWALEQYEGQGTDSLHS